MYAKGATTGLDVCRAHVLVDCGKHSIHSEIAKAANNAVHLLQAVDESLLKVQAGLSVASLPIRAWSLARHVNPISFVFRAGDTLPVSLVAALDHATVIQAQRGY